MAGVLVIGGGGREHAIAWKMAMSDLVKKVWVAPGNGAPFLKPTIDISDADSIVSFCHQEDVALVVVGPELPLSQALVDRIDGRVPVFGPTQAGAMLETSKVFSKNFMREYGLPTAAFHEFDNKDEALTFIDRCEWRNIVVKADGLAAGKGVVVSQNKEQAKKAAADMLDGAFGSSGRRIILEEKLDGYEVSALCFTDGLTYTRMPLIRDHKRLLEGDKGPNTGGMGVIGPVSVPKAIDKEIDRIIEKTIHGLRQNGVVYKDKVIYAGLMITSWGPQLLEYNCRFGDPETEIIMRLLKTDLYSICLSCVEGNLSQLKIDWDDRQACGIILSSANYPYASDKGTPITNISVNDAETVVFQAGTSRVNDQLLTNGGRILCVTSLASDADTARLKAIAACEMIAFNGKFFRRDIGINRIEGSSLTLSYGDSGVNINEGNAFVEDIKAVVRSTLKKGTGQIGGFGALVDLATAGYKNGSQIVIGMDGVGTKIEIADAMSDYSGIGFDVVGMCVNDVLCHCATPIAFLDYFVCGRLDRKRAVDVVTSISRACIEADCSLVGGETAEMPGVYGISQWDLAGCAIAVREPSWPVIPNSKSMRIGDSLIGLRSNGIHSNGFSLVRKIFEVNGISYKDRTPWDENKMFGEVLLAPTRLYVRQLLPLMKDGLIKGCAHITGGGIEENAIRVLDPKDQLSLEVDASSWTKATLFDWISEMGPVSAHEMLRTFNSGIGMVLVVGESVLSHVEQRLRDVGEEPLHIGRVVKRVGDKLINFTNMDTAFSQQKYKRTRPKVKVGILISGTGSNMVKLIEKSQRVESNCEVVVVISNKATAKGLIAARKMGVETVIVPHTPIREEGDAKMTEILRSYGVQLVCLAGYMRLMSPQFVNYWKDKILNIHPSLLPSFKGAHAVRDALQFGVKVTGCSVHYVDEEMDHGPLVAQDTVFVDVHDTEESLQMKIQAVEHKIYPEAMEKVAAKIISQQKL